MACAEKHVPGLAAGTRTRIIVTPADFRKRVGQKHHSFGGIAPVRDRPNPSYRTPITNLWFAGSQSQSGGGVLGVKKGARALVRVTRGPLGLCFSVQQRGTGLRQRSIGLSTTPPGGGTALEAL